jgi:hypothetical protein
MAGEHGVEAAHQAVGDDEFELGGLHFEVSFRDFPGDAGATCRVFGEADGLRRELLRFDDFVANPHYHVPADGEARLLDRTVVGAPLDWCVAQLTGDFGSILRDAGLVEFAPTVDQESLRAGIGELRRAMEDCLPEGFVRVDGIGLQRVP